MLRWLATIGILLLLALDLALPRTDIGRRGNEAEARRDVEAAPLSVGAKLPDFELTTLSGETLSWKALRGHRVLLVFERSVDW